MHVNGYNNIGTYVYIYMCVCVCVCRVKSRLIYVCVVLFADKMR